MNVSTENLASCKKLLRFEIGAAQVDAALDAVADEFAHKVKLPGFRPGKVPRERIVKQFDKEIEYEARRRLMNDSFRHALQEQKINLIGQPDVEEVEFGRGQGLVFTATIETSPEFETPEYRGLPVRRETARVTDEDVEKAIETLRGPKAQFNLVDRAVGEGDIAVVNYKGTCEGQPINELAPTAQGLTQKNGFWIEIKSDAFIPGFAGQLVGAAKGEKRTVEIDFPADFVSQPLAGKHGVYEVEVCEVRERALPAVDEAFANQYGAANLEELRKGVRQDLQNELNSRQRRGIRNQLARALLERAPFDLPESMIEQETRSVVFDVVNENQKRGVAKDVIEKNKDDIYVAAKQTARDRVRMGFLVHRIADAEGIRTTDSEVNSRIVALAQSYNMAPKAFVKDLEKRNGLPEIYQQIIHEKVLDFLHQNAKIEDVEPAPAPAGG